MQNMYQRNNKRDASNHLHIIHYDRCAQTTSTSRSSLCTAMYVLATLMTVSMYIIHAAHAANLPTIIISGTYASTGDTLLTSGTTLNVPAMLADAASNSATEAVCTLTDTTFTGTLTITLPTTAAAWTTSNIPLRLLIEDGVSGTPRPRSFIVVTGVLALSSSVTIQRGDYSVEYRFVDFQTAVTIQDSSTFSIKGGTYRALLSASTITSLLYSTGTLTISDNSALTMDDNNMIVADVTVAASTWFYAVFLNVTIMATNSGSTFSISNNVVSVSNINMVAVLRTGLIRGDDGLVTTSTTISNSSNLTINGNDVTIKDVSMPGTSYYWYTASFEENDIDITNSSMVSLSHNVVTVSNIVVSGFRVYEWHSDYAPITNEMNSNFIISYANVTLSDVNGTGWISQSLIFCFESIIRVSTNSSFLVYHNDHALVDSTTGSWEFEAVGLEIARTTLSTGSALAISYNNIAVTNVYTGYLRVYMVDLDDSGVNLYTGSNSTISNNNMVLHDVSVSSTLSIYILYAQLGDVGTRSGSTFIFDNNNITVSRMTVVSILRLHIHYMTESSDLTVDGIGCTTTISNNTLSLSDTSVGGSCRIVTHYTYEDSDAWIRNEGNFTISYNTVTISNLTIAGILSLHTIHHEYDSFVSLSFGGGLGISHNTIVVNSLTVADSCYMYTLFLEDDSSLFKLLTECWVTISNNTLEMSNIDISLNWKSAFINNEDSYVTISNISTITIDNNVMAITDVTSRTAWYWYVWRLNSSPLTALLTSIVSYSNNVLNTTNMNMNDWHIAFIHIADSTITTGTGSIFTISDNTMLWPDATVNNTWTVYILLALSAVSLNAGSTFMISNNFISASNIVSTTSTSLQIALIYYNSGVSSALNGEMVVGGNTINLQGYTGTIAAPPSMLSVGSQSTVSGTGRMSFHHNSVVGGGGSGEGSMMNFTLGTLGPSYIPDIRTCRNYADGQLCTLSTGGVYSCATGSTGLTSNITDCTYTNTISASPTTTNTIVITHSPTSSETSPLTTTPSSPPTSTTTATFSSSLIKTATMPSTPSPPDTKTSSIPTTPTKTQEHTSTFASTPTSTQQRTETHPATTSLTQNTPTTTQQGTPSAQPTTTPSVTPTHSTTHPTCTPTMSSPPTSTPSFSHHKTLSHSSTTTPGETTTTSSSLPTTSPTTSDPHTTSPTSSLQRTPTHTAFPTPSPTQTHTIIPTSSTSPSSTLQSTPTVSMLETETQSATKNTHSIATSATETLSLTPSIPPTPSLSISYTPSLTTSHTDTPQTATTTCQLPINETCNYTCADTVALQQVTPSDTTTTPQQAIDAYLGNISISTTASSNTSTVRGCTTLTLPFTATAQGATVRLLMHIAGSSIPLNDTYVLANMVLSTTKPGAMQASIVAANYTVDGGLVVVFDVRRVDASPTNIVSGSVVLPGGSSGPFFCTPTSTLQQSGLPWANIALGAPPPALSEGERTAVAVLAMTSADLQTVAAIGMLRCSPGSDEDVESEAGIRALVPVALSGTCAGAVQGALLAIGAAGVLSVVAMCIVRAVKKKDGGGRLGWVDAAAMVRCPGVVIAVWAFVQMGLVVCGARLATSESGGSGDIVLGVVGVLAGAVLPVVCIGLAWGVVSRRCYRLAQVPEAVAGRSRVVVWARSVFLPSYELDAEVYPVSKAFSTVVGRTRRPSCVWAGLSSVQPVAMLLVLFVKGESCNTFLVMSGVAMMLVGALCHVLFRPHRIVASNYLQGIAMALNAAVLFIASKLVGDPLNVVALDANSMIAMIQVAFSVCRTAHTVLCVVYMRFYGKYILTRIDNEVKGNAEAHITALTQDLMDVSSPPPITLPPVPVFDIQCTFCAECFAAALHSARKRRSTAGCVYSGGVGMLEVPPMVTTTPPSSDIDSHQSSMGSSDSGVSSEEIVSCPTTFQPPQGYGGSVATTKKFVWNPKEYVPMERPYTMLYEEDFTPPDDESLQLMDEDSDQVSLDAEDDDLSPPSSSRHQGSGNSLSLLDTSVDGGSSNILGYRHHSSSSLVDASVL